MLPELQIFATIQSLYSDAIICSRFWFGIRGSPYWSIFVSHISIYPSLEDILAFQFLSRSVASALSYSSLNFFVFQLDPGAPNETFVSPLALLAGGAMVIGDVSLEEPEDSVVIKLPIEAEGISGGESGASIMRSSLCAGVVC